MTITSDERDLAGRLCRALDITARSLTLFSERGYTDTEVTENSFRPDKPIAEAAMLVYASSGLDDYPGVAERRDHLAGVVASFARSPRVALSMALHPSACVEFAVPHILLTKMGFPDEQFDRLLTVGLDSEAASGHERPPFASLERKWLLSLWSGEQPDAEWETELQHSVLKHPIDILGGFKEDAYALTHLVVYCTDFGFDPTPILPRGRSVVLAEARSLLAKCLDEEDYDVAAELLMFWPQLGEPWCASSSFGFRVLRTVEDQVGVLPSVRTKNDRLQELQGEEKTRYAYATAYHTSLVMGLLCAVALRSGTTRPQAENGLPAPQAAVDELLSFIAADQGHWQPVFADLPDAERVRLAPFLRDVALAQAVRRHDYDAAKQVLDAEQKYDLAGSPLSAQAVQLLERVVTFALVVGERGSMPEPVEAPT